MIRPRCKVLFNDNKCKYISLCFLKLIQHITCFMFASVWRPAYTYFILHVLFLFLNLLFKKYHILDYVLVALVIPFAYLGNTHFCMRRHHLQPLTKQDGSDGNLMERSVQTLLKFLKDVLWASYIWKQCWLSTDSTPNRQLKLFSKLLVTPLEGLTNIVSIKHNILGVHHSPPWNSGRRWMHKSADSLW